MEATSQNCNLPDYNQPVDAALFPEGCQRCSLLKFLLHLVPVLLVGLWGAYAAFRVLAFGLGETGLDDYFGFGLWITFDLAVIALGAGAFFSGALRYLLNLDPLKNIINLAVVVGFLCYSGAMLVLVLDIGQPLRAWFGYWHPNVHSMLTEVIFCITCYCTVLIIEYVPLMLENRQIAKNRLAHAIAHNFHLVMPLFAGIGAFLSTFHQGSLGGMYGVLFARPYILRDGFFIWPWTFFLYILSAVGSGPMFTVLVATFMTFDQMFHGWIYGKWLLFAELFVCGLLPAFLLFCGRLRAKPAVFYTAGILACVGVTINRYVMTVQALAIPVMPFDTWEFYTPNWAEWGASCMVIAYAWLCLAFSYRYLPMFPQERELNR